MSVPLSATAFINKRPWLRRWFMPFARWYKEAAGYRKIGLKCDDLIPEEREIVLAALKRLPPKEAYDRVYRLRRAFQCSLTHTILPKEEQITEEEDEPYLMPLIHQIAAERKERADLDAMTLKKS